MNTKHEHYENLCYENLCLYGDTNESAAVEAAVTEVPAEERHGTVSTVSELFSPRQRDRWEVSPSTLNQFRSEVELVHQASWWEQKSSTRLEVVPIEDTELPKAAVDDSLTKLALTVDGTCRPIRDTAKAGLDLFLASQLKSLRMGDEAERATYLRVANLLCKAKRKEVRLLTRNGAFTATQSDQHKDVPPLGFFEEVLEALKGSFGAVSYTSGDLTQAFTSCLVELPDAAKEIDVFGTPVTAVPLCRIFTSDVGSAAATVQPLVRLDGDSAIPFLTPFRVVHKGHRDWSRDLRKLENSLLAGFQKAFDTVEFLTACELRFPKEAALRAAKRAKIPAAVYRQVANSIEYEASTNDVSYSAYDVISMLAANLEEFCGGKKGMTAKRKLQHEDAVGRLVLLDWEELDVPVLDQDDDGKED